MQRKNKLTAAAATIALVAIACASETSRPREDVGARAAALGVHEYEIDDDVVTLFGATGQPLATVEAEQLSDGGQSLSLASEEHTLAIDAAPGSTLVLSMDGEERLVVAPGSDAGTLELSLEEFDQLMMLLAVQEDVGVGALQLEESDGSIDYSEQVCVKVRPCATWAGIEIICVSIEICWTTGT